jgi:hypothetical protein
MIFPRFNPKSFWSYEGACELFGARYPAAPLGMIKLAEFDAAGQSLSMTVRDAAE